MVESFTLIAGPKLLLGSAERRALASLQGKKKFYYVTVIL